MKRGTFYLLLIIVLVLTSILVSADETLSVYCEGGIREFQVFGEENQVRGITFICMDGSSHGVGEREEKYYSRFVCENSLLQSFSLITPDTDTQEVQVNDIYPFVNVRAICSDKVSKKLNDLTGTDFTQSCGQGNAIQSLGFIEDEGQLLSLDSSSCETLSQLGVNNMRLKPVAASVIPDSHDLKEEDIRVLHLGGKDAAGQFGRRFHQLLNQIATQQETYGCVGAGVESYATASECDPASYQLIGSQPVVEMDFTPDLPRYLQNNIFDVVIFSLDSIPQGDPVKIQENMESLMVPIMDMKNQNPNFKCYWLTTSQTAKVSLGPISTYIQDCEVLGINNYANADAINSNDVAQSQQASWLWAQLVCKDIVEQVAPGSSELVCQTTLDPQSTLPSYSTLPVGSSPPNYANAPTPTQECSDTGLQEIDQVWLRLAPALGTQVGLIYDPGTKSWKQHISCEELARQRSQTSPTLTPTNDPAPTRYDQIIKAAALEFSVDPALLKAIIKHESHFRPDLISSTGCSGLGQVCMGSANPNIIRIQCKQYRDKGPQPCGGIPDDRFDPQKNIRNAAWVLRGKMDSVGNCGQDSVKAWVSSYNLGQARVKEAIRRSGGRCDVWRNVWNTMNANFNAQTNTLFGETKSVLTRSKIDGQLDEPGRYVGDIYRSYLQFKQEFSGSVVQPSNLAGSSCASNKIAILGDSITVGWGNKFKSACSNQPVNYAVGGKGTGWMLSEFDSKIKNSGKNVLIIQGGTNDVGRDISYTKENLAAIYSQAKAAGMRVIATTIPPFSREGGYDTPYIEPTTGQAENQKIREINQWIMSQKGTGVDDVIDFYTLLVGDGICFKPSYGSCSNIHPNSAGYSAMARTVQQQAFS